MPDDEYFHSSGSIYVNSISENESSLRFWKLYMYIYTYLLTYLCGDFDNVIDEVLLREGRVGIWRRVVS